MTFPAGRERRTASMMLAWFSSSVKITVDWSVSVGIAASFAFQHETYVSAASVPERSASARSSSR